MLEDGIVLRAEESSGDMYASVEAALKKLEQQIRRHRKKLERRLHEGAYQQEPLFLEQEVRRNRRRKRAKSSAARASRFR